MEQITEQAIRDFVTHRFVTEGKDSTVREIAAGMGVSEAKVRKIVGNQSFNRDGWADMQQESRVSESRNYPGMNSGVHKVWVYGPSRKYMANVIASKTA